MAAPKTAWVPRKNTQVGSTAGNRANHRSITAVPLIDQGDPFPRHIVRPGDFYQIGKIRSDPGVNVNLFTQIPEQQSIMERFFGRIMPKVYYRSGMTTPRGVMFPDQNSVNVDKPEPMTMGDFATYTGTSRRRIRSYY